VSVLSGLGLWQVGSSPPAFTRDALIGAARAFREPVSVVREAPDGRLGVGRGGRVLRQDEVNGQPTFPLLATLPPCFPEWLGDRSFLEAHLLRFPYVTGSMANGIATPRLVIAMAKAGMLGFFGAAGLSHASISRGLDEIDAALAGTGLSWGSNLIHSPNAPDLEAGTVALFLKRNVVRVEASAFMALTPPIVRYAFTGVRTLPDGRIWRRNHVFAKVSRVEVARRFLTPPPAEILDRLVAEGHLTAAEATLARKLPVAEDVSVEADSGGHTDNRPLVALFPTILSLRDELMATHRYERPIRVGAGGGIGTPASVAAAFALGAAYVFTGSVNQASLESGLSEAGRAMLCTAGLTDVTMAPAADMFELGVQVQVLQRGTLFASRAQKLYDAYTSYGSIDEIPTAERERLEKEIFLAPLSEIWAGTKAFWMDRDPREVTRAEKDPKHLMALCFRWYLGLSSRWAIAGDPARRMDYQIWCGPSQGAFNDWVKGSFLEPVTQRSAVQIALNLLEGAAMLTRAQQLRSFGLPVPSEAFRFAPRPLES
jgi:trans-AT polyketide synthase/acyltransferase/oxidoreductase domain-containing protein